MKTVYLMRHGMVENPGHVLYGSLPGFPLSAQGRRQIAALAKDFRDAGVRIARIVSSPALRAQQTAGIVAEASGGIAVATDERLGEWGMGRWEGKPVTEFRAGSGYFAPAMRVDGMEPLEDLAARVVAAIEDVRKDGGDAAALVVSHREPLAAAILSLRQEPFESIHEVDLPVASVWEIVYEDGAALVRKAFDRHGER